MPLGVLPRGCFYPAQWDAMPDSYPMIFLPAPLKSCVRYKDRFKIKFDGYPIWIQFLSITTPFVQFYAIQNGAMGFFFNPDSDFSQEYLTRLRFRTKINNTVIDAKVSDSSARLYQWKRQRRITIFGGAL